MTSAGVFLVFLELPVVPEVRVSGNIVPAARREYREDCDEHPPPSSLIPLLFPPLSYIIFTTCIEDIYGR